MLTKLTVVGSDPEESQVALLAKAGLHCLQADTERAEAPSYKRADGPSFCQCLYSLDDIIFGTQREQKIRSRLRETKLSELTSFESGAGHDMETLPFYSPASLFISLHFSWSCSNIKVTCVTRTASQTCIFGFDNFV